MPSGMPGIPSHQAFHNQAQQHENMGNGFMNMNYGQQQHHHPAQHPQQHAPSMQYRGINSNNVNAPSGNPLMSNAGPGVDRLGMSGANSLGGSGILGGQGGNGMSNGGAVGSGGGFTLNADGSLGEDDRRTVDFIVQLLNANTRETALLELSKKREAVPELALVLWHSYGTFCEAWYTYWTY